MSTRRSSPFSPRQLAPEQLEALTVAREPLLRHLRDSVVGAVAGGQARFDLIIGPRGAGKSHTIGVLEHRLRAAPELAGRTLVIAPPEELHPTSLVQLLALLLREFPDDPEVGPVERALASLRRQSDGDRERRAVTLIRGRLAGRSMIVLVENLDEIFAGLGRGGQQRLRNVLQTERSWSIVATSRSLVPAFTKHEAPFHGTFNIHRLEPLSAEQCRDMLVALADAHERTALAAKLRSPIGLARARGLRHILSGNPRVMAFVFNHLDERRIDEFELALADLAEELTPYFQEQMTRLSPAQRNIMELLAENWRPLSVGEIAEHTFTSHGSASGTLRHLRKDGLVEQIQLGRERFYELRDPLHRIVRATKRKELLVGTFARVVRWWFSNDDEHSFGLRSTYPTSERSRDDWVAADGGDNRDASSQASGDNALSMLKVEHSSPELEFRIGLAWHFRVLDEDEDEDEAMLRMVAATQAETPVVCSGLFIECLTRFAVPELLERLPRMFHDSASELILRAGIYAWLASRRPLEPLARLVGILKEQLGLGWLDAEGLHVKSPKHAVARLTHPERELVRLRLQQVDDTEGLAYFGFSSS